jgi:hypothetical protein
VEHCVRVVVVVAVVEVDGGEVGLEALGVGILEGWVGRGGAGVVGIVAVVVGLCNTLWRCDGRERWAAGRCFVACWTRRCGRFERACTFGLR